MEKREWRQNLPKEIGKTIKFAYETKKKNGKEKMPKKKESKLPPKKKN